MRIFFVVYESKLNIIGFETFVQIKEAIINVEYISLGCGEINKLSPPSVIL